MDKPGWETKARAAFERYLTAIKATLPPEASFADMERAILKFSPEIMRSTLEGLAASVAGATTPDEDFSPGEKAST